MRLAAYAHRHRARLALVSTFYANLYAPPPLVRGKQPTGWLRRQFGCSKVIAVWYAELPLRWRKEQLLHYAGQTDVTFSDAISAERRWLWDQGVVATPAQPGALAKIPPRLRTALLPAVAPAA